MPFDYPFGIFWPLYRLSDFDLCLLITTLVSLGHCIGCRTSIYAFWLPLWYLLAIVSSVLLRLMPSDYPFGICWPLYRLSYFKVCLLITPLLYFGHCIVCPSSIDAFWLPLCIFWPLYCLSYFDLCLLITPLVCFGHCIVCPTLIYAFWLSPSVSVGHCIVCPSSIDAFWLPLWYVVAIVSSILLRFTPSDYPFGIIWPLYRLSYFDLCLLITPLVSFGHCIVCPTLIYAFWLSLRYLLAIVSSVLLRLMPSDYPFGILWPLYHLSYFDLCLLITPLVSCGHCIVCPTSIHAFWLPLWYVLTIVSSVLLWFMPSDYHIGICWPLYRLSYFNICLLITPLLYVGHCIVCPTSIYAFWLPLWYLLALVSSVLLRFMPFDYPFGIFWPLYLLSFFDWCLLITPLVSCGHCIVCPTSIYAFWLPLWYHLAIVSSVLLRLMPSDYLFGILWPLYRLSYFDLCLLITTLVSVGHCIVCPTSMYVFWLALCYMLAIVSSLLLRFMPSDYLFGICLPLYRLSYFDLCLLITPLVSFAHCIVCPTSIYAFWLPLWYLLANCIVCPSINAFWLPLCYMLAIVSSVLLRYMPSDYLFGICLPLYRLSYFDLCLLITHLVSFGHCIVCPTLIYAFWLPHWYLLAIVSSVVLQCMSSDYPFVICWQLYRLSYFDLCLLITSLVSFGHCIVCPTSIYAFWLPLWYLLAIVSSVLLWFMPSDYPFGIFWPLYRLSFFDWCLLITPLVSVGHCIVCRTSMYVFWSPFVICWPLYRLSCFDLCLLITLLVSFGHYIVCPTLIYAFWLPLWNVLAIVSSVLLWFMPSDYPFGIFWPLHRLSFFDWCLLITTLVSFAHCIVCPTLIYAFWLPLWYLLAIVSSLLLQCMPSDYPFGIFWPLYRLSYFDLCLLITPLVSFAHCIVCPTSIYAFWLPLWYLLANCIVCPSINAFWLPLCYMLAIVSSVLLRYMPSDYLFGICLPLYRLSYFDLCLLITHLVSFGHCIVCPTLIYAFWLPHWYLLAIVSAVVLRFMPSDYPLVSFGHCIVCPSSIDAFWLPLWYLLAIVSSVVLQSMSSDYPFFIFWPLYRLSYFDLCLLITSLVSVGPCIVCPTSIYAFWLPIWYLLAIVSSVLLRVMPSDYPFGILWPLYRLSCFDLCLLITPLVSFGHCIVCPTSIDAFWLPLWYLLTIVSSVLLWFMPSDYHIGICWPLYRLSYFNVCLLITPLLYVGHCIVCPTSIYAFWLPLWYLFALVSSVLLWFVPSDYPFGIFCPLYRLSYFDLCLLITPLVSFGKLYRLSFD